MGERICKKCGTPMGFVMYGSAHIVDGELCKTKQNVSHKEQQLKASYIANEMLRDELIRLTKGTL